MLKTTLQNFLLKYCKISTLKKQVIMYYPKSINLYNTRNEIRLSFTARTGEQHDYQKSKPTSVFPIFKSFPCLFSQFAAKHHGEQTSPLRSCTLAPPVHPAPPPAPSWGEGCRSTAGPQQPGRLTLPDASPPSSPPPPPLVG